MCYSGRSLIKADSRVSECSQDETEEIELPTAKMRGRETRVPGGAVEAHAQSRHPLMEHVNDEAIALEDAPASWASWRV